MAGTPPLMGVPAGAAPEAAQDIHIHNFNLSRDWGNRLSQQMMSRENPIPVDVGRLARAESRTIKLGGLIEHADIPAYGNNAIMIAIQDLTNRVQDLTNQVNLNHNEVLNQFAQIQLDNRCRDFHYTRVANSQTSFAGPFLIVPSPLAPHVLPTDAGLPPLTNGEAIQNLSNLQANHYLNFYQVEVHIGIAALPTNLPQKRRAIGQAIGLPANVFTTL